MKKERHMLFSVLGGVLLSRGIDWTYMAVSGQLNSFFGNMFSSDNGLQVVFNILFTVYAWICPVVLGIVFGCIGYKQFKGADNYNLKFTVAYLGTCAFAYLIGTVLHYAFMYELYGLPNLIFY